MMNNLLDNEINLTDVKKIDMSSDMDAIRELIAQGADLSYHISGNSALHTAVYKKDLVLLRLLLDSFDGAGIDEENDRGQTPYGLAVTVSL